MCNDIDKKMLKIDKSMKNVRKKVLSAKHFGNTAIQGDHKNATVIKFNSIKCKRCRVLIQDNK